MFRISGFLLLLVLFVSSSLALEPKSIVPDFDGETFDGKTVSIQDYKGKVIVIDFWASWCGPCKKEMPYLVELYKEYSEKGLEIISINIDRTEKNALNFLKALKVDIDFVLIYDKKSKIVPLFNPETMPTTYIVDKKGIVRFVHDGFQDEYKMKFVDEIETLLNE